MIMKCQKIIDWLDNTSNQQSKFKTKNWLEINDQSRGVCNTNSDIRFKTTMLKSSLCDYSDAYILMKRRRIITEAGADAAARQVKLVIHLLIEKSEINNTEIDNATKDTDIVMPMYNLIEHSNYSKAFESLWQYYYLEPSDSWADSEPFKSQSKNNRKYSCWW